MFVSTVCRCKFFRAFMTNICTNNEREQMELFELEFKMNKKKSFRFFEKEQKTHTKSDPMTHFECVDAIQANGMPLTILINVDAFPLQSTFRAQR